MFAHVAIRASDLSASERFYRSTLGTIGVKPTHELDEIVAWDDFAILAAESPGRTTRNLHLAFVADSRRAVDDFWEAGVEAGYRSDGEPGERPRYSPSYYGAFLLDPDGNSAEAVHHDDTRRGGHIDHLWIGVRDLAKAEAFYNVIARHTGLRPGRRWEAGVQFRGPWATFTLMADGRPATENLHMAFRVPERRIVDEFHAAATAAGYDSNGAPGERPQYGPGYYAAFVLDPDGTNIEAVV